MSCGARMLKEWSSCSRPGVFPDGKCHQHTTFLKGRSKERLDTLRDILHDYFYPDPDYPESKT